MTCRQCFIRVTNKKFCTVVFYQTRSLKSDITRWSFTFENFMMIHVGKFYAAQNVFLWTWIYLLIAKQFCTLKSFSKLSVTISWNVQNVPLYCPVISKSVFGKSQFTFYVAITLNHTFNVDCLKTLIFSSHNDETNRPTEGLDYLGDQIVLYL